MLFAKKGCFFWECFLPPFISQNRKYLGKNWSSKSLPSSVFCTVNWLAYLYSLYPRLYLVTMPCWSLWSGSSQVTSKLVEVSPVMRTFFGGPPGFSPSVTNWNSLIKSHGNQRQAELSHWGRIFFEEFCWNF